MKIVIDTNGLADNTTISFNGEEQKKVGEFHLSIIGGRKLKLQMKKDIEGKEQFLSYFGEDFKKFDELKEN